MNEPDSVTKKARRTLMDHGASSEVAVVPDHDAPTEVAAHARVEALEERIRRLEDTVAILQDTRHLEERVVERVSSRLQHSAYPAEPESTGIIADSRHHLLPVALEVLQARADTVEPPSQAASHIPRHPWILFDFFYEIRAMFRMYFDRRYRMQALARFLPIVALTIFLLSWFFIDSMRLIGPLLDKAVDVVLVCLVYKVLSRESQRYRQLAAGLPPAPRF
jgi:hypothetical protein